MSRLPQNNDIEDSSNIKGKVESMGSSFELGSEILQSNCASTAAPLELKRT